jgi:hypothetical protein
MKSALSRHLIRLSTILAVLVVLLGAAPPVQPTFLGVVTDDGLLTPVAVFDGHDWWNRWPWGAESEEIRALPLPRSLDAIPAEWLPPGLTFPRAWTVQRPNGAKVPATALAPTRRQEFALMDTILIRTTFKPHGLEVSDVLPAIAGPGVLGRFTVPKPDEEERVLRQLDDRLIAGEKAEIARWMAERRKNGVTEEVALTQVYMVTDSSGDHYVTQPPGKGRDVGVSRGQTEPDGRTFYSFGGEKLFRISASDNCMMNLSWNGVVVTDRRGRVISAPIAPWAFAEYCGDFGEWNRPLATVRVGDKTVWLMQVTVEDGDDYMLFDPEDPEHPPVLKGEWSMRQRRPRPAPIAR